MRPLRIRRILTNMSLEEFCSKWIADVPGKERQFVNDASGMVADEAVEIVKLGLITRAVGHGCELSDGDMEGAGMVLGIPNPSQG